MLKLQKRQMMTFVDRRAYWWIDGWWGLVREMNTW